MPRKTKGKHNNNSGKQGGEVAITALSYSGPIVKAGTRPRDDLYTTVLGLRGSSTRGASSGTHVARFFFRANSSASIPASMVGDWSVSVGDSPGFSQFSGDFGSFRVLGVKVTIVSNMEDSTDGFGCPPLESTVIRENASLTANALIQTPGWEFHCISTGPNHMSREMKMEGTDEAEWVDCANVYTAISPAPAVVVVFPDTATIVNETVFVQWRVQFRSRRT